MAQAANENTGSAAAPSVTDSVCQDKSNLWALALGSVGVVYGDIGTSPLYAFRVAVVAAVESGPVTRDIVLGVLSLIVWALIVVVAIKYVLLLLRADNNGEGGTLSLTALATRAFGRRTALVFLLGVVGASMFLGDAVITPAISVLSAVEGLTLVTPAFEHSVVPLTIAILLGLFAGQSRGTARVASFFAPVMVIWFIAIAAAGLLHIHDDPGVLAAVNPAYAVTFLYDHGHIGLATLGLVFLVVTGAEALYADLGHFGRRSIQTAWFSLVLPATVIASQAVITGAYSLVRQAIQLGLLPRLAILHTSASQAGQIYIPRVTGALLVGVLLLVGLFRTSSALASAYGIAVATTMVVDGLLAFLVIWKFWHWPLWRVGIVVAPLVLVDVIFFSANLLKLLEGAWAPILFGASMVLLILTWRRGTSILAHKTRRSEVPLDILLPSLQKHPPHMVPGTAVFLTSQPEFAPTALLHNLKHNKVLHEHNVILTVITTDTPRVMDEERVKITVRSPHFSSMTLKFGYMESPNVPKALAVARKHGWHFDIMSTSFFLSRRALKPASHSAMPRWQDRLFIGLAKSASDATDFFHIPTGRVVEVGTQVAV